MLGRSLIFCVLLFIVQWAVAGQVIKPISNQQTIQSFIQLLNKNQSDAYAKLTWNADHKYLQLKEKDYYQYYQLYLADINNTGQQKYVLTQIMQGSGNYSSLVAVYQLHQGKLIPVDVDSAIQTGLHLSSPPQFCQNWYCSLAQPFLTQHKKQVYMNFSDINNGKQIVCTYLWQGDQFKLIGNRRGCIAGK